MNNLLTELDFVKVGHTGGLHGYDGSVRLNLESEISEWLEKDGAFLYFLDNGMYVPRFVRSWNDRQSLIGFERITAREEARILADQDVYLRKTDLDESFFTEVSDLLSWNQLVDYQIWNVGNDSVMGRISAVEEYPGGWMAEVHQEGRAQPMLIPLAEPLMERVDTEKQMLYMRLPEGLDEI